MGTAAPTFNEQNEYDGYDEYDEQPKKQGPLLLILIIILALLILGGIVFAVLKLGIFSKDDSGEDAQIEDVLENSAQGSDADGVTSEDGSGSETGMQDAEQGTETEDANAEQEGEAEQETKNTVHHYEIVAADISWRDAKTACEERGGYLATITSQEEYDQICELANPSGLTYLWLGATLYSDDDEWENDSWITGESWTFDNWYPGEPSKHDTDGTNEFYLCLWNAKYDGNDIGWTFNDQRNDLVTAFEFTKGKVGYVFEFETEE